MKIWQAVMNLSVEISVVKKDSLDQLNIVDEVCSVVQ